MAARSFQSVCFFSTAARRHSVGSSRSFSLSATTTIPKCASYCDPASWNRSWSGVGGRKRCLTSVSVLWNSNRALIPHGHQLLSPCSNNSSSLHTQARAGVLLAPSRAVRAKLMSQEGARDFVDSLSSHQRDRLLAVLDELREEEEVKKFGGLQEKKEDKIEVETAPPTWLQLRLLCYQQALPFLGFGFLDNFVMITVGEYIDLTLGATFTISTMAAAGLGNLISDLAGLGLADRVEALCRLIGIPNPRLSSAQLHYTASRWMGLLGRCLGIIVGCLIGMLPLLWFSPKEETSSSQKSDG